MDQSIAEGETGLDGEIASVSLSVTDWRAIDKTWR